MRPGLVCDDAPRIPANRIGDKFLIHRGVVVRRRSSKYGNKVHTTSPSAPTPLVSRHQPVHRIPHHVRDDAYVPLVGAERGQLITNSEKTKEEYFCARVWTNRIGSDAQDQTDLPVGRSGPLPLNPPAPKLRRDFRFARESRLASQPAQIEEAAMWAASFVYF